MLHSICVSNQLKCPCTIVGWLVGWINQIITYPNITNSPYLTFGLSERPSASGSARMGDSVPSVLKISNLRIN